MVRSAGEPLQVQAVETAQGPLTPADRIVAAALTCVERDGIEATGIREIAREAGVNSAAINYYFRSKENLIGVALERSLENAFGDLVSELDRLRADGASLEAALTRVIDDYLCHVGAYPRLGYALLRDALVNQRYDGRAVRRLNQFLEELCVRILPPGSESGMPALRLMLVQLWSGLIALGVLPQLFEPFLPIDFTDPELRSRYVRQLLAPIMALSTPAEMV